MQTKTPCLCSKNHPSLTTVTASTTIRSPLRRSQHRESLNQPHCRPSRNTSNQNHLKPADQTASTIPRPLPTTHEASFGIPKDKQCKDHCQNRPAQRQECIVGTNKEIRDQGDKTTNEVTECNGQCTDNCSWIRGLRECMVEVHEERREHGRRW